MRKIITFFMILSFALIFFTGISCKEEIKYGDANGQIKCPVMNGNIDKKVYVDHNGKRIYMCCAGCIEKFNKDPEKYMKKIEGVKLDDAPGGMSGHEGHNHN